MKPIESIIANYLAEYPALKAIHKGRVCQGLADQKWAAPYQTIFLISDPPDMKRIKIPTPRLQINNFSCNYGESRKMVELTYEALDGFSGVIDGVTIGHGSYQDMSTDYEEDTNLYNTQFDIIIVYHAS